MGKTKKIKNLEGVGLFHPFQNTLYIYCPYILSLICGTNMLQRFNSAVTNLTNTGIVHMQYNFSAVSCGSCSPRSTCDRRQRTSVNSKAAYTGEFLEEASSSTYSHKKIPAQSNIDLALCLHRFLVGLGWLGWFTWPCLRWAGRGRWSSPSRAPPSGRR